MTTNDTGEDVKKYAFNLYPADIRALEELVSWGAGKNVTQALRQAIATQHFLRAAVRNGDYIFLENTGNTRREVVFADRCACSHNFASHDPDLPTLQNCSRDLGRCAECHENQSST